MRRIPQEKIDEVLQLRREGMALQRIAQKMDISFACVQRYCQEVPKVSVDRPAPPPVIPRFADSSPTRSACGVGPDGDPYFQRIEPGSFVPPSEARRMAEAKADKRLGRTEENDTLLVEDPKKQTASKRIHAKPSKKTEFVDGVGTVLETIPRTITVCGPKRTISERGGNDWTEFGIGLARPPFH